jgi:hypothetical protein
MKKIYLLLFTFVSLSYSSCKKVVDKLTTFDIKHSAEFTVPKFPLVGQEVFPIPVVTTNIKEQLEKNGTDIDRVEDIRLDQMSLTIISPTNESFNFLKSLDIKINAEGLGEKQIAYITEVLRDQTAIPLTTTGEILDAYVKQDKYSLDIKPETREPLLNDVTIRADMVFKVRAKLIK